MKDEKEIRDILFKKIENASGNTIIKQIAKKVDVLNSYLDGKDTKIENLIDDIRLHFTTGEKKKIYIKINDILDKYSKIHKDGTPVYSNDEKAAIEQLVVDIDTICNENFIERFKNMLKGS